MDNDDGAVECVRRGSARANVPLSAFGRTTTASSSSAATATTTTPPLNATAVAEHLLPTFVYAAQQVPVEYHATTAVYYQATAGMRLLPADEQEAVYDALYEGLHQSPDFVFALQKRHIATLSGQDEGYYGAVAANYLKGTIDANLEMIPTPTPPLHPVDFLEASVAAADLEEEHLHHSHHHHHHGPIGALDMGGSSTQIVFLPGNYRHRIEDRSDHRSCSAADGTRQTDTTTDNTCHAASPDEMPSRLNGQDFFATSYLSYGVDQFRERLWTTWVNQHKAQLQADSCCDAKILENPCTFKGYEIEWHGYTLVGTGDAHACVEQVQRLIPHHEPDHHEFSLGSHVGGVQHPPVRGKFFAMSLYFFTLDSLRELSHPDPAAYEALNLSWPTPSIAELYNALDGLCSRSWEGDLQDIADTAHAFTRPEVLPHRCLESVYMVTLLKDGFGFAPESRDITFTFLVDGSEVEWSLGMALVLRQEETTTSTAHEAATPTAIISREIAGSRAPDSKDRTNATEKQTWLSSRLLDALSERVWSSAAS